MAWEERGSCLNIFRMTNRGRVSETFTNYEAKDLLRKREIAVRSQKNFTNYEAKDLLRNMGRAWIMSLHILDEKSWSDLRNLNEFRVKRLVAQVIETRRFALYLRTVVDLMFKLETSRVGRSVDHVLTYSGRKIASSWHGRSVDHVLAYSGGEIAVGSQKPSQITRPKTCCASECNMSVLIVFANRSGFDVAIGVFMAWEKRGSCLNIFQTKNHGLNVRNLHELRGKRLVAQTKNHGLDVRNLHELRGKRLVAQVSETRLFPLYLRTGVDLLFKLESSWHGRWVRFVFANLSGFDVPIGVVKAWEECGSCLNIFRTKNRGQISETFANYEAKDLLYKLGKHDLRNPHELGGKRLVAQVSETRRFELYLRIGVDLMVQLESSWYGRSVDHVLTYSRRQIMAGSQKPSRITRQKTCCPSLRNLHELRGKRLVAQVSETRGNLHELRGKRLVAQVSETRWFALYLRTGVDLIPIGVVMAWDERGSCVNIFRKKNRGLDLRNLHELRGKRLFVQLSETRRFVLYLQTRLDLMFQLESSWLGRSVDHVITYFGREIMAGSQKPS
ncbi:uncharacterized protein G2W53_041659 [Senna tora]|uniref:Uncharacterized protein n=1 Tax=Senna tora TaxID=362788 RepID=A0A834VY73_9FABA|nr:uncharacterized protein G2W53_041659 [Senna tora]